MLRQPLILALLLLLDPQLINSFQIFQSQLINKRFTIPRQQQQYILKTNLKMSDWSTFQALDDEDDDEIVFGTKIDRKEYAVENDDPEIKAAVGLSLNAPIIIRDAEPLYVLAGTKLELDEDTVLRILSACRNELGTLFGYTAENRGVGITGSVEFIELDGGVVVLSLDGRYWHQRPTVLQRVANYLQQRIPEILDVIVEDPYQLTDEANAEAF